MTTSLIFIVVTVLLASLYFMMPFYYEQVKTAEARNEFEEILSQVEGKSTEDMLELLGDYSQKSNRLWFTLMDTNKKVFYPTVAEIDASDESLQLTISPNFTASIYKNKYLSETIKNKAGQTLLLQGEYSLQPISDASRILLKLYPMVLFFALTLGGLGAYLYSRTSSKRIKEISRSTRRMTSLEPQVICPVKGRDEIADLAQDINHLYENLLTSIEALRLENEKVAESEREKAEFLRMTSHELKTPITSMMGMIDGMIYGVGEFKDHDTYLHRCRTILEEQAELVQSILAISKLEMKLDEDEEDLSLKSLLKDNLSSYKILAEVKKYQFEVELEELEIKANKTYLLKAIKNLLDNAFHYTRQAGKIRLSLGKGQLVIENQAERLLDEQQIQQIFQPFYRPDYSRNRKDGGTGLGLFIVQQILEKHHFNYRFEAVDESWMRFTIFF
nr:HAMP domain-containing sensor histidine kinase [Streptococcus oricebi]